MGLQTPFFSKRLNHYSFWVFFAKTVKISHFPKGLTIQPFRKGYKINLPLQSVYDHTTLGHERTCLMTLTIFKIGFLECNVQNQQRHDATKYVSNVKRKKELNNECREIAVVLYVNFRNRNQRFDKRTPYP